MIRHLRYFAVVLFLLAPCVARCDDLPVIDNTLIDAFTNMLDKALFVTGWGYDPSTCSWGETKSSVFLIGKYPNYGIGDYLYSVGNYLGLTVGTGVTRQDIWQYLERNQYGYIVYNPGSDPYFEWTVDNPPNSVQEVPGLFDWILSSTLADSVNGSVFSFFGNPEETVFGLAQAANTLFPKLNDALDKINQGGGVGGGDQTIHIEIHGGVTNIVNILTNHFDRATNHFNVVSNSLTVISNSVTVITNQFDLALDLLRQIASNTQQEVQISILEWMTNDWPSVACGWPDSSNEYEEVSNLLKVAAYAFNSDNGPVVKTRVENDEVNGWIYSRDDFGRYHLDGFAYDIDTLDTKIRNGEWDFGEVVTFCLQGILDKSQDIKNSLWILNHSFDTNSVNPDISELDTYKREVDSFVQGTQGSLESVFHNVELDEGVFSRFKSNFVAIFGTVGKGPPMLRGAKGAANRQTVWTFYVGDQQWDVSLDSTLYTSSRRLCRMAASMVWCVLLWMAFRKILIRAVYWLVKCIDWSLQVFGFQIKWLGTVEEFLKHIAGIGPGG